MQTSAPQCLGRCDRHGTCLTEHNRSGAAWIPRPTRLTDLAIAPARSTRQANRRQLPRLPMPDSMRAMMVGASFTNELFLLRQPPSEDLSSKVAPTRCWQISSAEFFTRQVALFETS